jgi:hypothetical protein
VDPAGVTSPPGPLSIGMVRGRYRAKDSKVDVNRIWLALGSEKPMELTSQLPVEVQ